MPFGMRREDKVVTLLTEVFPKRTHVIHTEMYLAKCLEGAAATMNEGNRMPTLQYPKRGAKEVQGKGENRNS